MGLFGAIANEVHRNFVARADGAKNAIIYKYPDTNIRKGTELTVGADEVALFFRDGKIAGTLQPGRHTLTSDNVPFLGMLIDAATGGNLYVSEIYFVTTREIPSIKFGGPVGDLQDPQTQMIVSTGVFGEVSVKVTNPETLLVGLIGMKQTSNEDILSWFKQLFMRTMKETIAELIVKKAWPLLQVTSGAYTEEICTTALDRSGPTMGKYGLSIVNMANFTVSVRDEDLSTLKNLARDTAMSKLAGGYNNYAMGEAMMRGGGGNGASGMDMMGMAAAQQMMRNAVPQQAAPTPAAAAPVSDGTDAKSRLAKLKGLLADGLVSQEEFDAKRKEILAAI